MNKILLTILLLTPTLVLSWGIWDTRDTTIHNLDITIKYGTPMSRGQLGEAEAIVINKNGEEIVNLTCQKYTNYCDELLITKYPLEKYQGDKLNLNEAHTLKALVKNFSSFKISGYKNNMIGVLKKSSKYRHWESDNLFLIDTKTGGVIELIDKHITHIKESIKINNLNVVFVKSALWVGGFKVDIYKDKATIYESPDHEPRTYIVTTHLPVFIGYDYAVEPNNKTIYEIELDNLKEFTIPEHKNPVIAFVESTYGSGGGVQVFIIIDTVTGKIATQTVSSFDKIEWKNGIKFK